MIQVIGLMGAAYIFTRMFIIFIQNHPNESKSTDFIIKALALLTALFAVFCAFLLTVQGTSLDPNKIFNR